MGGKTTMETINPYQSPLTSPLDVPTAEAGDEPIVDGKCLVLASGTVLPPICVKTNQPISDGDMVRKRFDWCPPWIVVFVVLGPIPLILAYFLARKKIRLTYGLKREFRLKRRRLVLVKVLVMIGFLVGIPLSVLSEWEVVPIVFAVVFVAALIAVFIGNSTLTLVSYRQG
ncbi:MAG: hypothetical protein ACOY3P_02375, partial [Planctomycetota bacterium]